ncbi:hypothetical protein AAMO2058_000445800 [Amorphochlora amoebiformis]
MDADGLEAAFEFDAPQYYDFSRTETIEEILEAEEFFLRSHPGHANPNKKPRDSPLYTDSDVERRKGERESKTAVKLLRSRGARPPGALNTSICSTGSLHNSSIVEDTSFGTAKSDKFDSVAHSHSPSPYLSHSSPVASRLSSKRPRKAKGGSLGRSLAHDIERIISNHNRKIIPPKSRSGKRQLSKTLVDPGLSALMSSHNAAVRKKQQTHAPAPRTQPSELRLKKKTQPAQPPRKKRYKTQFTVYEDPKRDDTAKDSVNEVVQSRRKALEAWQERRVKALEAKSNLSSKHLSRPRRGLANTLSNPVKAKKSTSCSRKAVASSRKSKSTVSKRGRRSSSGAVENGKIEDDVISLLTKHNQKVRKTAVEDARRKRRRGTSTMCRSFR